MGESADPGDGNPSAADHEPAARDEASPVGSRSRNHTLVLALAGLCAVALVGVVAWQVLSTDDEASLMRPPTVVVVGSASVPESQIVAELYSTVLDEAGMVVNRELDAGVREQFTTRMAAGDFDLAPDNIGILTEDLNQRANGEDAPMQASGDAAATTEALRNLAAPLGASVAEPAPADSGIGFAVSEALATEKDLQSLSDLAKVSDELSFGGPAACSTSSFCLPGLKATYGIEFKEVEELDLGGPKTLNALTGGTVDVGIVMLTDPSVDERDLVILDDDKHVQVAQNVTAVMRSSVATPEVLEAIEAVNAKLTTKELRALDGRVTVQGLSPQYVAAAWAAEQGLIPEDRVPPKPSPTPAPTAEPSAPAAATPHYQNRGEPSDAAKSQNWDALAQCESGGDPTIVSSGGSYHGLYQFSDSTWQAMGGSGSASDASAEEQTYRAQLLWDASGAGQWPACGKNL